MKKEFENVETFVLLDWFVADFNSKFLRYHLTGDCGLIQRALGASSQGVTILARMKKPIQKIAKELKLDIDQETVHTEVNGNWVSITYLSFGIKAKELAETYAIRFVNKILKSKMSIETPPLRFKIFYLPSLPVATTDEGHIMHTPVGFTSVRRKRIEINVYPPRDYESIFKNIVHEIFHVCFLEESSMENVKDIESRVEAHAKSFFDECKNEWKSERIGIIEDLRSTIEKKLSVFKEADSALMEFRKDLAKADFIIETFKELFDAIAEEKVKAIEL